MGTSPAVGRVAAAIFTSYLKKFCREIQYTVGTGKLYEAVIETTAVSMFDNFCV
jgi:hypothetical protein